MDDTSLDDYYADQQSTFLEVFVAVVNKMRAGVPVMGAKEEMMEDFIEDWCDAFDEETVR